MYPIDYSQTIMYRIICKDLNITYTYVGHTTNLTKRRNRHKTSCNNLSEKNTQYNLKVYQVIRENGGWNNWIMIEIEKYSCKDGNEARKRERYWYEFYNAKLNSCLPIISKQEILQNAFEYNKMYYYENQQKSILYAREYRKKNNEIINLKNKVLTTCICGSTFIKRTIARHIKTQKHIKYLETIKI